MHRRLILAAFAVAATLGVTIPATAAAAGDFSCRASAERVVTFGNPPVATVEPTRANVDTLPCSTQSAETVKPTTILGGILTADAARALTSLKSTDPAAATAHANISKPKIGLGGLNITVDAVSSDASATCGASGITLAGSSRVVNLTINGSTIAIPATQQKLSLGALGSLTLNEQVKTATGIIQRAVHLQTPLVDVVLAESIAGYRNDPCTGINPTGPKPCPPGSEYDVTSNLCVIRLPGTTRVIVIGRPFRGPSGGTVVPLTDARKRYNSPCLHGAGPQYAVIGTNKADRITGTNKADRILGLGGNDSIDGGRGNDCLDGGRGGDKLSGGIGNDRIYGMTGNDRLNGSSGRDYLNGGRGNDTINAGYGRDRVIGGTGRDHINIGTAGPPAKANCGAGFDKIRLNPGEVQFAHHCEVVFIAKKRSHGTK